ncbi:hypothetical protein COLO4_31261 [Corchorus olitorius]|uniref:Uncharacterized protein n=1 Tax=Corchorus olitorius TaxID=93759 RepID=A0A1R3H521_9ROSI|nr:hypothetical protein COLO4_31261 [Corchorus olitorius]
MARKFMLPGILEISPSSPDPKWSLYRNGIVSLRGSGYRKKGFFG